MAWTRPCRRLLRRKLEPCGSKSPGVRIASAEQHLLGVEVQKERSLPVGVLSAFRAGGLDRAATAVNRLAVTERPATADGTTLGGKVVTPPGPNQEARVVGSA